MGSLSYAEAQTALARDHVNGRHARRSWNGCPVCDHFRTAPLPEWRRRALESVQAKGYVAAAAIGRGPVL